MTAPAQDPSALVLTDLHPSGYAVLTLNRPQAMNALSKGLMTALADAGDAAAAIPAGRVRFITGAGKAFTAGLDLKEIGAGNGSLGGTDGKKVGDPVAAIHRCAKPVIGAINGAAVTGGFELALACDVLIASSSARFADTHARIGVAPGWGLSQRLSRAIGPYRAREVSFTGNWVSAEQAAAWGFVNRVLQPDELLPAARQLALDMLGTLPEMLTRYKAVINDGYAQAFGDALALEKTRARAFNGQVAADDVEARREAVRARNRSGG
ncbi:MAG: enoyl-CoA hydratase [Burkholderiales bacterium PBB5]|nr:MAG: enoyl-CoA hydratase [Burkholderiales bacterium PBB5]